MAPKLVYAANREKHEENFMRTLEESYEKVCDKMYVV
jgi:CRISPR/Cas system CSM-associated protein Csm2 small subunit